MKIVLFAVILFWTSNSVHGQKASATIATSILPSARDISVPNPQYNLLRSSQEVQQQNMRMIEQDMRNYEVERQRRDQAVKEAYKDLGIDGNESAKGNSPISKVNHRYAPNKAYGKIHFEKAFNEITDMVDGRKPYNLKRAVFLTEHAYDTTLRYDQFQRQIEKLVGIIQLEMKQKKISPNDNVGKIMTAFRFMTDTLKVRNPALEKTITTYPKTYDFEDFYGMKGYHKMFVSKLIRSGKGQCHSLPLLFLILCQEINAKAYLSFAPEHAYVKFADDDGNMNNIELTNQMFTTDQFILQSGYITSAAIKSRIYMDTLAMDRVINYTLNDLANNYVKKYGYDDFVLRAASREVVYDPKSIHGFMHMANYYNILGHKIETQYQNLKVPREYYFNEDQEFREIITNAIKYGQHIDNLGFAQMPPDMYSKWLSSLKNESMRQQHIERKKILMTMTEF